MTTADITAALYLYAGDQRRIRLKSPLHTLAAGYLAHGKGRIETTVTLGNDGTLVRLNAFSVSFHHLDVDDNRISRGKIGNCLAQAADFFAFKLLDQIHFVTPCLIFLAFQ